MALAFALIGGALTAHGQERPQIEFVPAALVPIPNAQVDGPAIDESTADGSPADHTAELNPATILSQWITPPSQQRAEAGNAQSAVPNLAPWIQTLLIIGALSVVPAIALMTTSYIRVFIVLSLLRQAIGAAQLPPNQVIAALAIFISLLVMAPTWRQIKHQVVDPVHSGNEQLDWSQMWDRASVPLKQFMYRQIEAADNTNNIWMLARYLPEDQRPTGTIAVESIPIEVLLPAFVISELKVAFLIGFQIYLPFLVLDLVVAAVTVSMGMLMVPPAMISVPLKLILFVLADGWTLVVGMLLDSFAWEAVATAPVAASIGM